jgi:hypothetical protein
MVKQLSLPVILVLKSLLEEQSSIDDETHTSKEKLMSQVKVIRYQLTKSEMVGLVSAFKMLELAHSNTKDQSLADVIAEAASLVGDVTASCVEEIDPQATRKAELARKIAELQAQLDAVA